MKKVLVTLNIIGLIFALMVIPAQPQGGTRAYLQPPFTQYKDSTGVPTGLVAKKGYTGVYSTGTTLKYLYGDGTSALVPTSAAAFTAKSFLYSDAAGQSATTAAPTNGKLLIGSTGAIPVSATLTGTANEITVTNGAGSITLATPQAIGTSSNPSFNGLSLTGLNANAFIYSGTASALTGTATPANGELLIGSTGVAPTKATLTGTANQVVVTNGAGSITLSTPQSIATSSTPAFAGLTLTGKLIPATANITMGVGSSALNANSADVQFITGDAGTNTVTSIANGTSGQRLTLVFRDNLVTLSDASTLKLNGDFVSTADDVLSLVSDGTNWYEISRSAN